MTAFDHHPKLNLKSHTLATFIISVNNRWLCLVINGIGMFRTLAFEGQTVVTIDLCRRLQGAIKRSGETYLTRLITSQMYDNHLIRRTDKDLTGESRPTKLITDAGNSCIQSKIPVIGGRLLSKLKLKPQIPQRQIGLGERSLHLLAKLVGFGILTRKNQPPYLR